MWWEEQILKAGEEEPKVWKVGLRGASEAELQSVVELWEKKLWVGKLKMEP